MSVDVTKMPKLGFGLMRLPEKDGELDLEQHICTAEENPRALSKKRL